MIIYTTSSFYINGFFSFLKWYSKLWLFKNACFTPLHSTQLFIQAKFFVCNAYLFMNHDPPPPSLLPEQGGGRIIYMRMEDIQALIIICVSQWNTACQLNDWPCLKIKAVYDEVIIILNLCKLKYTCLNRPRVVALRKQWRFRCKQVECTLGEVRPCLQFLVFIKHKNVWYLY